VSLREQCSKWGQQCRLHATHLGEMQSDAGLIYLAKVSVHCQLSFYTEDLQCKSHCNNLFIM